MKISKFMSVISIIKVADYTQLLDKRHAYAEEYSIEEIDKEFASVCKKVFGVTLDDISKENMLRLIDESIFYPEKEAIVFALSNGFDITYKKRPLHDWKSFMILILSKKLGFLPSAEELQKLALQREITKFRHNKTESSTVCKSGYIKSVNEYKNYGFIKAKGISSDIYVNKSEMNKANLQLSVGLEIIFEVIEGNDGRLRAVRIQRDGIVPSRRQFVDYYYGSKTNAFTKYSIG